MDTQNVTYVKMQRDINKKKIEKLQSDLHIVAEDKGEHTVFVENRQMVREFDAAKHFGTTEEFVERRHNRPTEAVLEGAEIARPSENHLKRAVALRETKLGELKDRLVRADQLQRAESEMLLRRAMKEKGKKKKVGKDRLGLAVYKWKAERKK
ncbi:hypothetical protein IWW38_002004 [Coemansia aciculifera]|uniref:Uncharacterized protein n=1 Tax=Coemansia aciculifera TaxID=417176 RepID=A0ACC1M5M3_9FUNG|nr:hypothetical protein IWW38_002004 [Coemansia aciculifera]